MQTQTKQKTCAELISARYVDRAKQFSELEDQCCNETLNHENYGEWSRCFNESILAFDFIEANTFDNQPDGYHRLQLSWGGPSDEVRYYTKDEHEKFYKITYSYMDWFDGAEIEVFDDIWHNIFNDFTDII
jgi:hypothetical protein